MLEDFSISRDVRNIDIWLGNRDLRERDMEI